MISARWKLQLYHGLERVAGRRLLYRLGRFLYLGARRELYNSPEFNGEHALIEAVLRECRKDCITPVLIDTGANLGDWTAVALTELGKHIYADEALIIAFEPAPAQRQAFAERHSVAMAQGRLRLRDKALGAAPGSASFEVTGTRTGTSGIRPGQASAESMIAVDITTVDELFDAEEIGHVALLKVDTEGNDFNVILGARQALSQRRIGVVQFEYNWRWLAFGHSLRHVFDFAAELGLCIGRLTGEAIEIHSAWHPELDHYFETNFVLAQCNMLSRLPHRMVEYGPDNTVRRLA